MKTRTRYLSQLALCLLAVCPAIASAALPPPPSTSAYNTDTTNSYVQDQTTQAMSSLNSVLCYINAVAPAQMVNLDNYIALIDQNICDPNVGGGNSESANSGAKYLPVIVNASRSDNNSPMIGKMWLNFPEYSEIAYVHLSATQAPNLPTDPFGRFRMDYCSEIGGTPGCAGVGYINATANGLDFYENFTQSWGTYVMKLKLNAVGSTGSGALDETYTGAGMPAPSAFSFAYNADYFRRSDGLNDLCFNRSAAAAAESVWSYGLYDRTTGARIERNTGFPIEYTGTGGTLNGYIGYWGLSSPTLIASGTTVNKVTYDNGSVTKTPYTLMQTGGKLIKYSQISKKLADLDKIKFQFWTSVSASGLTAYKYYEVYWDNTNTTFQITGQQDSVTHNIVPYAAPVPLSIANMMVVAPYSISAWSNMFGGSFTITSSLMASMGKDTPVRIRTQDVVYPSEFPALGGMKCINNCPTAADIALSNAASAASPVSPFDPASVGWASSTGKALYSYTLNANTGNLMDAAANAVISAPTTGNNLWGITSGRLVAAADLALLDAALAARPGHIAGQYTQADIDALTTYYEWQTGPNNWNQLTILKDAGDVPVRFEPPLNVTYLVPSEAKYGVSAGASITLQYGGFGNLWGIPSSCIDAVTNTACVFSGGSPTAPANQRWTPEFSIPTSLVSVATVPYTQGTVVAGTAYLIKALQKEVRLANVPLSSCSGLTVPGTGAITLPNPSASEIQSISATARSIGAMPTFNPQPAPRVIHGVKMY